MSKRIVAVTREIQLQTDAPSPPNHWANHRVRAKARAKAHSTLIGPFFAAQVHPPYPAVILTPFKCNVSCFAVVLNHNDAFCVMLYACVILVVMHQSCSFHVGGSYARAHGNNEHDTTHGLRTSHTRTHTHTQWWTGEATGVATEAAARAVAAVAAVAVAAALEVPSGMAAAVAMGVAVAAQGRMLEVRAVPRQPACCARLQPMLSSAGAPLTARWTVHRLQFVPDQVVGFVAPLPHTLARQTRHWLR